MDTLSRQIKLQQDRFVLKWCPRNLLLICCTDSITNTASVVVLPQTGNLNVIMREHRTNPNWEAKQLQSDYLHASKTPGHERRRLRNCSKKPLRGHDIQMQCVTMGWILEQKKRIVFFTIKHISEAISKIWIKCLVLYQCELPDLGIAQQLWFAELYKMNSRVKGKKSSHPQHLVKHLRKT